MPDQKESGPRNGMKDVGVQVELLRDPAKEPVS